MRKLPARFSNRKAFFLMGLLAGVMLGMTYGMVRFNAWSQSHSIKSGWPVKISFHAPVWIEEVSVATLSANVRPSPLQYVTEASAKDLTEEEKKDNAIRKYFPEQFALAKAIAMSEGYRSNGVNSNPPIEESVGIFQVNLLAHYKKVPGQTIASKTAWLLDYENNCKVARQIYDSQSWNPWAGYTSGSYRRFL